MIFADTSIDVGNLTGVGVGAVLLALVFRTLWRQEGGWRSVLTASREDAAQARADAAAARVDAAAARDDARLARTAEAECRLRLARLDREVAQLKAASSTNARRLDELDPAVDTSGEVPIIDPER